LKVKLNLGGLHAVYVCKKHLYLFVNLYLPCSSTDNKAVIAGDLLDDFWSQRERYNDCECVIAGDINCNYKTKPVSVSLGCKSHRSRTCNYQNFIRKFNAQTLAITFI